MMNSTIRRLNGFCFADSTTLLSICPKAKTAIGSYTLSLHDALPSSDQARGQILFRKVDRRLDAGEGAEESTAPTFDTLTDRKSTRLNTSHVEISYAVFCLKKKHNRRLNGPPFADSRTLIRI